MATILNWLTVDELAILAYGTPVGARKGWDTRGYALSDEQRGRDGKEVLMKNGFVPKRFGELHDQETMDMHNRYWNYEVFNHPSGAEAMVKHDAVGGNHMVVKSGDSRLLDSIDKDLNARIRSRF